MWAEARLPVTHFDTDAFTKNMPHMPSQALWGEVHSPVNFFHIRAHDAVHWLIKFKIKTTQYGPFTTFVIHNPHNLANDIVWDMWHRELGHSLHLLVATLPDWACYCKSPQQCFWSSDRIIKQRPSWLYLSPHRNQSWLIITKCSINLLPVNFPSGMQRKYSNTPLPDLRWFTSN